MKECFLTCDTFPFSINERLNDFKTRKFNWGHLELLLKLICTPCEPCIIGVIYHQLLEVLLFSQLDQLREDGHLSSESLWPDFDKMTFLMLTWPGFDLDLKSCSV